jgi:hypothetical protein
MAVPPLHKQSLAPVVGEEAGGITDDDFPNEVVDQAEFVRVTFLNYAGPSREFR